ncbi:MAG: NAD-dependent epimerase/dehydratase family protein [Myxococcota bacterium]
MRILVTGGAGFIGSHVADAFVHAGHDVVVFDDLSTGRRENVPSGAEFVQGDLREDASLQALFSGPRFDVISHQGAQTSVSVSTREPIRDAEINVVGGIKLLRKAVESQVPRFVFASTGGAIYGEVPEGSRAGIDWTPRPLSPYACSKLAFEGYVRAFEMEHGISSTILRYANVYGPRQDPHGEAGVVAIFCGRILGGQSIRVNARREPGDDGCVRDYVYVSDVVAANVAAAEGLFSEPVVNIGTGVGTATRVLADILIAHGEAANCRTDLGFGPRRDGDLERSVLEPSHIPGRDTLVGMDTGLRETFEYFRSRA